MKNIMIYDGAANATFSIFQATDEEFAAIFPGAGQDLEVVEEFVERVGEEIARKTLEPIWLRPIYKGDAQGIHGTLFYDYLDKVKYLPNSRREMDRDSAGWNGAERLLYEKMRKDSSRFKLNEGLK